MAGQQDGNVNERNLHDNEVHLNKLVVFCLIKTINGNSKGRLILEMSRICVVCLITFASECTLVLVPISLTAVLSYSSCCTVDTTSDLASEVFIWMPLAF